MSLMCSCETLNQGPSQIVSDSFCTTYQQIVVDKGDGSMMAAQRVKRRIAANETVFRCKCLKEKLPICEQL